MRETGSAAGVGGSGIQIALLKGAEHRWELDKSRRLPPRRPDS